MKCNVVLCLLLISGIYLEGCKHPQIDGGVTKKTFVLSDTMLKTIRIDTANLKPVLMELHFSGKVAENERDMIVNVATADLHDVTEGYEADVVTASLPHRIFHGKVDGIHTLTDSLSQTGQLSIKMDLTGKALKPEMFTKVVLHCDEGDDMVAVPETAVIEDHSRNFVLVFKDKYNIQVREVETYTTSGDVTYISKGLNAGESVISAHQQQIYNALR
jgi:multidrug efflux pump subunit AcrA (membrane-fusion protein)